MGKSEKNGYNIHGGSVIICNLFLSFIGYFLRILVCKIYTSHMAVFSSGYWSSLFFNFMYVLNFTCMSVYVCKYFMNVVAGGWWKWLMASTSSSKVHIKS